MVDFPFAILRSVFAGDSVDRDLVGVRGDLAAEGATAFPLLRLLAQIYFV